MNKRRHQWLMPLPGMELLHIEEANQDEITIGLETSNTPGACPRCTSTRVTGYGRLNIKIRDVNLGARVVFLNIKRRRFRCQQCLSTFNESIRHISEHHRATERFIEHIGNLALQMSFTAISRQYRLDEKTIRNIFNEAQHHRKSKSLVIPPELVLLWTPHLLKHARSIWVNTAELSLYEMQSDIKPPTLQATLDRLIASGHTKRIIVPPDPAIIKTLQKAAVIPLRLDSRTCQRLVNTICLPFLESKEIADYQQQFNKFTEAISIEEFQGLYHTVMQPPKPIKSKMKHVMSSLALFADAQYPLFEKISDECDIQLYTLANAINNQFARRSYEVMHSVMILDQHLHKFKRIQSSPSNQTSDVFPCPENQLDYYKMDYGTQINLLNARLSALNLPVSLL
ncbi:helix-turn-helix domain-containing protein [Undibacterium sp.]|uniref:helix-turn-helix domain-containing protein n=1 Tax=Undibacterium sp. TaxID=1914977 RepID=UPI002731BF85|nr:helix-turn-helix domain-containing protein [Undibacterium sp.]MDP1978922.1 helix-turn-helix domain-containing protein [Undibacterium sp.]